MLRLKLVAAGDVEQLDVEKTVGRYWWYYVACWWDGSCSLL